MPVVHGIHLFASHKGGTGKTLLSFQAATQFAFDHPEINVLVFDLTELGDLSKRMLGHDEKAIEEQCGAMFDLLSTLDKHKTWFAKFQNQVGMKNEIDFEKSVHPSEFNAAIPKNLWLVSSGVDEENAQEMDVKQYANDIRRALEVATQPWKVFVDTDGDRRPALFTQLGYCLADYVIIPLQADIADFQRLEAMIDIVAQLSEELKFHAKISQVIWNRLQLNKTEADVHGSFQLTKVEHETVTFLNKKLYERSKNSDLFLHRSEGLSFEDFCNASTVRVRDFPATVCIPSNSQGIPFCCMKPGRIPTSDPSNVFTVGQAQIDGAVQNIHDMLNRLESMVR